MRKVIRTLVVIALLVIVVMAASGNFLVIDRPQRSDVILVLAGETDRRPARALQLLDEGYASQVILDVPSAAKIYQWPQTELARKYADGLPEGKRVIICPVQGLSTRDESLDAAACLRPTGAHSVLLVTSDFHTRRALSIFQRELESYRFSVAAAYDPSNYGSPWWRHRQWAKIHFDECLRLFWWEAVDRWR